MYQYIWSLHGKTIALSDCFCERNILRLDRIRGRSYIEAARASGSRVDYIRWTAPRGNLN
jgi:hypothetical protein